MYTWDQTTVVGSQSKDVILFNILQAPGQESKQVTILGYGGNDEISVINTKAKGVVIDGGDGRDVIEGSKGRDILIGGAGNDQITARGANASLYGGDGDDIIRVSAAAYIEGGDGNDILFRNLQDNATVNGGAGDDTMVISSRYELSFEKTLLFSRSFTDVEHFAVQGSIHLSKNIMSLLGSISSFHNDDIIIHLTGDDAQIGKGFLSGDFGGTIVGSIADDVINLRGTQNDFRLAGDDGDDLLYGNDLDNIMVGGIGVDTLYGGGGDDKLYSEDTSSNTMFKEGDLNKLYGDAGDDRLIFIGNYGSGWGGAGNDVFIAETTYLHDIEGSFYGGGGNDLFEMERVNGTVVGGAGKDILEIEYGLGDKTVLDVEILRGRDLSGPAAALNAVDLLDVTRNGYVQVTDGELLAPKRINGKYHVSGSDEDNAIDLLHTRIDGRNLGVYLQGGDDQFRGTAGNETIDGGSGVDTIYLSDRIGHDTITDFSTNAKEEDRLDFSNSKIIRDIDDLNTHSDIIVDDLYHVLIVHMGKSELRVEFDSYTWTLDANNLIF
ncbi:Ca2+-binding RTX toxin-like protein [Rhizobium sp. SG_E_25_P2]|uniref:calcium-binding protein n=1 Tax=Rhizobium sp. SG_E_25_P2 TaxID=2879942 RepID=UPI002473E44A|nr:calcium-binding protein [Rhizobium sp. SG_E_25_P2]MDH6269159.1 Ca2+-binding RTX toxin-like protein [Rhizobium sp. SG_E_25_P2]